MTTVQQRFTDRILAEAGITTAGPEHDAWMFRAWRCTAAGHGDCFSADHISANRVAWEAARHDRGCHCWRHGVLRATGWPTVTGLPGSPHVIFEDSSLPHMPVISVSQGSRPGRFAVYCTCQPAGRRGQGPREPIATGSPLPAREAMAAYRQWHIDHGELVWP